MNTLKKLIALFTPEPARDSSGFTADERSYATMQHDAFLTAYADANGIPKDHPKRPENRRNVGAGDSGKVIVKLRTRHHHFTPAWRHIPTGGVRYRCRCGATYQYGPEGWTVTESPYQLRNCK